MLYLALRDRYVLFKLGAWYRKSGMLGVYLQKETCMGKKPKKHPLPKQVRKIRAVNRRFRQVRDAPRPDRQELDALMDEKDRLLNEVEAECPCEEVWVAGPDEEYPERPMADRAIAVCRRCGRVKPMGEYVSRAELRIRINKLYKRLGIDL